MTDRITTVPSEQPQVPSTGPVEPVPAVPEQAQAAAEQAALAEAKARQDASSKPCLTERPKGAQSFMGRR
jgi:hypothetical protein